MIARVPVEHAIRHSIKKTLEQDSFMLRKNLLLAPEEAQAAKISLCDELDFCMKKPEVAFEACLRRRKNYCVEAQICHLGSKLSRVNPRSVAYTQKHGKAKSAPFFTDYGQDSSVFCLFSVRSPSVRSPSRKAAVTGIGWQAGGLEF